jgi:DNA mismatch repair ATPase MutS
MEFKKTRVKQIITAIKTVRESFQQLEAEKVDNIKDFYFMSIENRLNMIEDYLNSLADHQPEELDKLQADYNNLLAKYRALNKRHNNLVDDIRGEVKKRESSRFSKFRRSEINSIGLALEYFNAENPGIIDAAEYENLMREIKAAEEYLKAE